MSQTYPQTGITPSELPPRFFTVSSTKSSAMTKYQINKNDTAEVAIRNVDGGQQIAINIKNQDGTPKCTLWHTRYGVSMQPQLNTNCYAGPLQDPDLFLMMITGKLLTCSIYDPKITTNPETGTWTADEV